MTELDLGAVIVSYGEQAAAIVALAARLSALPGCRVVVVANDLRPKPSALPQDVVWLIPHRNLGYGAAFNLAAASMQSDVFVLLNVDIQLDEEALIRLADQVGADTSIGVLSPLLLYPNGAPQATCGSVSRFGTARAESALVGGVRDCEWVTGALILVPRTVAVEFPMDGSYFLGFEDVDLCLRVVDSGRRVVCDGNHAMVHYRSQSIGLWWAYYSARNTIWFGRDKRGSLGFLIQMGMGILRFPRILAADLIKRRSLTSSRFHLLGLMHGLRPKPTAEEGPWSDEPIPLAKR